MCCVVQGLELDCLWDDWLSSCAHYGLGEILKADINWNSIFFFNFSVGRWCGGLKNSWVLLWQTELCSLSWEMSFLWFGTFSQVSRTSSLTSLHRSLAECSVYLSSHCTECTVHIHHDRQGGKYMSQVLSLWQNGNCIAECWTLLIKYRNYSIIQSTDFSINGEYETTCLN